LGHYRAVGGDVHVLFDLADPAIGPFPSDQFTVADGSQISGRRVALPTPDCGRQPTDCDDITISGPKMAPFPRAPDTRRLAS